MYPTVIFAYRMSHHSAIGFSPFFARFGREPRMPVDVIADHEVEKRNNMDDWLVDMMDKMVWIYNQIRNRNEESMMKSRKNYNKGRSSVQFKKGDEVYIAEQPKPHIPMKMQIPWSTERWYVKRVTVDFHDVVVVPLAEKDFKNSPKMRMLNVRQADTLDFETEEEKKLVTQDMSKQSSVLGRPGRSHQPHREVGRQPVAKVVSPRKAIPPGTRPWLPGSGTPRGYSWRRAEKIPPGTLDSTRE